MYQPAAGDRIRVTRTPSIHGGTGVMTGIVLDVLTFQGQPGRILDFKCDQGGHVYLASCEQMAAMGVTQTIEPAP